MTTGAHTFTLARARAGLPALIALGVIAAIATALVVSLFGVVRVVEAQTLIASIGGATGDRDRVIVRFEGDGASGSRADAIDAALHDLGIAGALQTVDDGDGVFTLHPDPAAFAGDAIAPLIDALPDLGDAVDRHADEAVQISGGLRTTLADLSDDATRRQGPAWIAIGIAALLAGVVVAAASVEPVRTRRDERALLRARGMSKSRLARITATETTPVLVVGAVAGAAVASLVLWAASGVRLPWLPVVTAAALLVGVGLAAALTATLRGVDRRSRRAEIISGISVLVLLGALTAVSVWQFTAADTAGPDGPVDPLVAAAPALILALAALVAVVLSAPLAAGGAALSARAAGTVPSLPLRLASRRGARHALTTGTVAFAASTIVLAVTYAGTLAALGSAPEALRVGADVRVTSLPDDVDVAALRDAESVSAAMAARSISARGAEGNIPIVAAQSGTLAAVVLDADGRIDPAGLADAIALGSLGTPLPPDADDITVSFRVADGPEYDDGQGNVLRAPPIGVDLTLLIVDGDGTLLRLRTTNVVPHDPENPRAVTAEVVTSVSETFALPGTGPYALAGIEVVPDEDFAQAEQWVDVVVSSAGAPVDLSGFVARGGDVEATDTGVRMLTVTPDSSGTVRESTRAVAPEVPAVQPAVITAELASSLDVSEGSALSLRMTSFSFSVDVRIERVVPVLPGLPDGGILLDLTALTLSADEQLHPNELWLATDDPAAAAADAEEAVPGAKVTVSDPFAGQAAAATSLAFIAAAIGGAALALVVLLLRRSRSDGTERELGLLAALGIGRRGAARLRAMEDVFAVVIGVVLGALGGFAASVLIVPALARAAYAGLDASFPVELDSAPLVLIAALVVATLLFVAVAASVRVPRDLAPILREAE